MLLRASSQISSKENARIIFQTPLGKRVVEYKRAQVVRCFVSDASPHDVSFIFILIHSFARKEVEGNGVGNSGFRFSIGCMGVGTQKGLILEQIRLNEMIHDLSFFFKSSCWEEE
jgi:hypothetical protein